MSSDREPEVNQPIVISGLRSELTWRIHSGTSRYMTLSGVGWRPDIPPEFITVSVGFARSLACSGSLWLARWLALACSGLLWLALACHGLTPMSSLPFAKKLRHHAKHCNQASNAVFCFTNCGCRITFCGRCQGRTDMETSGDCPGLPGTSSGRVPLGRVIPIA